MIELHKKINRWESKVVTTFTSQDFTPSDSYKELLVEGQQLFDELDKISKGPLSPEMEAKDQILDKPQY